MEVRQTQKIACLAIALYSSVALADASSWSSTKVYGPALFTGVISKSETAHIDSTCGDGCIASNGGNVQRLTFKVNKPLTPNTPKVFIDVEGTGEFY
ncbi:MAG TPA: hypothetical protein VGM16_09990, partial [Gammaproteobacteria bacterium]